MPQGRLPDRQYPGAVHAFTNPEATALGQKFNLPLKYDAKVDAEAKAEAPSSLPPRSEVAKGPPRGSSVNSPSS